MNAEWHRKNKFPKDKSEEEKERWRKDHRMNCNCGRKKKK
jgi:hypothetical protein